jgi:hypothetical protein
MTDFGPTYPQPKPPRRNRVRNAFLWMGGGFAGLVVLIIVLALAGAGAKPKPVNATPAASVAATPVYTPAASAQPQGTYTGSCSYTLGNDGQTYVATGEVDLVNTGNVSTTDKATITWPQEGYAPLSVTRTVNSPYGATTPVPFSLALTYTQISNLQNWQTGHSFADGCTYNATIITTYGPMH